MICYFLFSIFHFSSFFIIFHLSFQRITKNHSIQIVSIKYQINTK